MRYQQSGEGKRVQEFKNKHFGQRCFIIGNGPSLTAQDLDRLQNEITFASNKIFYIYDKTKWRPTYYCCFDKSCLKEEIDTIKKGGSYTKFLNYYPAAKFERTPEDHIWYLAFKGKFHVSTDYTKVDYTLSDDISRYAMFVPNVTISAIEIAIYMGFKEIYLLGVDHQYALQVDNSGHIHGRIQQNKDVKANYFAGYDMKGNRVADNVYNQDAATIGYKAAKKFAEERNVKIYNATRGGKLEVFERVDFDELMGQKKTGDTK